MTEQCIETLDEAACVIANKNIQIDELKSALREANHVIAGLKRLIDEQRIETLDDADIFEANNTIIRLTDMMGNYKSLYEFTLANFKRVLMERDAALAEVDRQKNCIRGLTDQCAALTVEKNSLLMDHGGALCDQAKIEMLEAMLAGDGALITGLRDEITTMKSALREAEKALVMNVVGTSGRTPATHEAIATIRTSLGEEE